MLETVDRIQAMTWNIQAGGFAAYDPTLAQPVRGALIKEVIDTAHTNEVSIITLTDAYRWDKFYGDNNAIAKHLGYVGARFVNLDDDRLKELGQDGIGIVCATDHPIAKSETFDLITRKALSIVLDIGQDGLQIASVYLDDMDEDLRLSQVNALQAQLEPGVPTILMGDFNALRPRHGVAGLQSKLGNLSVQALAKILPRRAAIGRSIKGMNRREVVPYITETMGYHDFDATYQRATAPARLPLFGIDYIFHSDNVLSRGGYVYSRRAMLDASDHIPVVAKLVI